MGAAQSSRKVAPSAEQQKVAAAQSPSSSFRKSFSASGSAPAAAPATALNEPLGILKRNALVHVHRALAAILDPIAVEHELHALKALLGDDTVGEPILLQDHSIPSLKPQRSSIRKRLTNESDSTSNKMLASLRQWGIDAELSTMSKSSGGGAISAESLTSIDDAKKEAEPAELQEWLKDTLYMPETSKERLSEKSSSPSDLMLVAGRGDLDQLRDCVTRQ
eukprot:3126913-Prymnesium_polylepis.1